MDCATGRIWLNIDALIDGCIDMDGSMDRWTNEQIDEYGRVDQRMD